MTEGWNYYNHAVIPTCGPHEKPDLSLIENGMVWSNMMGGTPLLARWTSDWDCGYETKWWYVIKDTPFDISSLKSKRRYEIKKGNKNFKVKVIDPVEYAVEILAVAKKAFAAYPEKYRPRIDDKRFLEDIKENWKQYTVFGAYSLEGNLCGYAYLMDHKSYSEFLVLKTDPMYERQGINAAIVSEICVHYENRLNQPGFYINDGSRAVRHETHFQDYLEKYFGFRKAYCKLHIRYRYEKLTKLGFFLLGPFVKKKRKWDSLFFSNVLSLIMMDSYKEG